MQRLLRIVLQLATALSLLICITAFALFISGDFQHAWISDGTRRSFGVHGGSFGWSARPNWPYKDPKPEWPMPVMPIPLLEMIIVSSLLPVARALRRPKAARR
jgi:hypothetical protein